MKVERKNFLQPPTTIQSRVIKGKYDKSFKILHNLPMWIGVAISRYFQSHDICVGLRIWLLDLYTLNKETNCIYSDNHLEP